MLLRTGLNEFFKMNTVSCHTISQTDTILHALARLNNLSGGAMTLFVTDDDGRLRGSLTDGDVRRALLRGIETTAPVIKAANLSPRALMVDNIDPETLRHTRKKGITIVPVVNAEGQICDIINLSITPTRLPLQAVVMAGGKGERLRPLTLTTPKPLLKIEGKAIIDYNIEAMAQCGITDITVTVNYLAEKLEEHFANEICGVKVKTVRETMPMGTIGAVALANLAPEGNTLVMNSDLLTTISFEEMYLKHRDTGADVTIAVTPYQISVPFAILDIEGDEVVGIREKPLYSHFANAGIYIFSNRLLKTLKHGRRTDATDLIQQAIDSGNKVSYYPINGSWLDIGTPADYAQARSLMHHHNNFMR